MKFLISFIFLFINLTLSFAVPQRDSTVRKYLVCERRYPELVRRSMIIKEGDKIKICSKTGRKRKGELKILRDTLILVESKFSGLIDTFSTQSIKKIRVISKSSNFFFTAGLISIPTGIYWLSLSDQSYEYLFGGAGMLVTGAVCEVTSFILKVTRIYTKRNFKFRTITTKGFTLKRKYIPYL